MVKIYPSLISANILNLEKEIKKIEPYCDGFHLDVMDFHFVQNLTFGPKFINDIASIVNKELFVHLMVDNPKKWIDVLQLNPKDTFCFHYEAVQNYDELINLIHQKHWLASVAINPKTSANSIFSLLNKIDHVLIMSVEPGFSGQDFMPDVVSKVDELVIYREKYNLNFKIGMDGGIDKNNIGMLAQKGVDDFAIASGIFKNRNPINALEELYEACSKIES